MGRGGRAEVSAQEPLPGDAFEVVEGHLYAGPYPSSPFKDEAIQKAHAFLDLGIDLFVDLTREGEYGSKNRQLFSYAPLLVKVAESRGVAPPRHIRRAIPDMGIPSVDEMVETVELIEAANASGETVYLHCWGGIGRTGTVLGCLAVNRGTPHDEVLEELARQRAGTQRAIYEAPQTDAQRAFVLGWEPRGPASA